MAGDKSQVEGRLIDECRQAGISVASINYRLSGEALAPAAQYDSARAVQFLRSKAKQWNLDPTRICLTGGSAGGGISLWIGFHDDLADPQSEDPIARESTRVTCIAPFNTQTTYDPRVLKTIVNSHEYRHPALMAFFGIKDIALADSPPPELAKLFEEVSPINYLTADDPPVYMTYKAAVKGMHSINLGTFLKAQMDALHIECTIRGPETPQYDSDQMEFIKTHLLKAETNQKAGLTTIQKATPTGIWLLLNSYGFKHPDQLAKLSTTPCWTNPNVDGIVLRADWDKIEPSEGNIDWSYFDRGLELAKEHNKRIEIIVPAGKHSPQWVYTAGAETFNFRGEKNKLFYMPIPWDPVLREKFGALITKVGQRYDSSPYLSLVTMTGFGRSTETWFASPDEMVQYNAIGGNAKWLEGAKWFTALYNRAFPKTPFLIAMCPPSKDDEGRAALQQFVEDCVKCHPGRFGLMACSLAPNDKPDSPKLSYQSVKTFSDQTVTGLEMLRASRTLKGSLKAALDTAIALKSQFVHVYEPDAIDPKQQQVLAEARIQLKRYQLRAEAE
jgi:acetyl esterase